MNGSIGAALTSAPPPVANLSPAGSVNPDVTPAAHSEGRSFHQVLSDCQDVSDAPVDSAPADKAAPPADEVSAAQLAALSALLGLVTELVQTNVAVTPAPDLAQTSAPAVVNAVPADETTSVTTAVVAADPAVATAAADPANAVVTPAFTAALTQALTRADGKPVAQAPAALSATTGLPAQDLPQTVDQATTPAGAPSVLATQSAPAASAPAFVKVAPDLAPAAPPVTTGSAAVTPEATAGLTLAHAVASARGLSASRADRPAGAADTATPDTAAAVISSGAAGVNAEPVRLVEPARLSEAQPLTRTALAPETLTALTQGLVRLAKSGDSDMRLQLQPENLGRIDLHITHQADGIRVTMVAQVAATAGLLDQHLDDLRHSLAQAGVALSGLSVGGGSAQQTHTGGQTGQGGAHQPSTAGLVPVADLAAQPALARPGEPLGLVDYWI